MLDPGALGTLIIRNDAERAAAERVLPDGPVAVRDAAHGMRVAIARGLRWFATFIAGPERPEGRATGAPHVASLRLTWTDRG